MGHCSLLVSHHPPWQFPPVFFPQSSSFLTLRRGSIPWYSLQAASLLWLTYSWMISSGLLALNTICTLMASKFISPPRTSFLSSRLEHPVANPMFHPGCFQIILSKLDFWFPSSGSQLLLPFSISTNGNTIHPAAQARNYPEASCQPYLTQHIQTTTMSLTLSTWTLVPATILSLLATKIASQLLCLPALHLSSPVHTAARVIFVECKSDHVAPYSYPLVAPMTLGSCHSL